MDTSPYSLDCTTAPPYHYNPSRRPSWLSSRQTLKCFLIVDPRACGCAYIQPRCVSTLTPTPENKRKPAKGLVYSVPQLIGVVGRTKGLQFHIVYMKIEERHFFTSKGSSTRLILEKKKRPPVTLNFFLLIQVYISR